MSPCGIGGASFFSSGMSVISASVVSRSEAMDAAFSSATRSTLVGSMIPAWSMSTNSMLSASKPRVATVSALTFSTTTLPSRPAFSTIWRIGSSSARLLRQALLQLLPVVVRGRLLDLGPNLLDAPLDRTGLARALDDRGLVLVHDHLLGLPEILELDVLQLDPEVLGDRLAAGQGRDVLEHRLAAVAEARRLHRAGVERAAELVDHERGQRLALDVLGDDQERLARPRHLLEQRQHVLHDADLLLVDQHDRVLEHDLHPLGVRHAVRPEVPAVQRHP